MPKASVHKDRQPSARENDVRTAGQLFLVQSVTESTGVKCLPELQFGPRVFRSNTRHAFAAFYWGKDIGHMFTSVAELPTAFAKTTE
jgi:hypothetical protein